MKKDEDCKDGGSIKSNLNGMSGYIDNAPPMMIWTAENPLMLTDEV